MIYTVVWDKSAEARLADLYNQAADPRAVTDSANRIEDELRADAERKGIPFGHHRVYTDDPLSVLYSVDPGDCMVKVVAVKQII